MFCAAIIILLLDFLSCVGVGVLACGTHVSCLDVVVPQLGCALGVLTYSVQRNCGRWLDVPRFRPPGGSPGFPGGSPAVALSHGGRGEGGPNNSFRVGFGDQL